MSPRSRLVPARLLRRRQLCGKQTQRGLRDNKDMAKSSSGTRLQAMANCPSLTHSCAIDGPVALPSVPPTRVAARSSLRSFPPAPATRLASTPPSLAGDGEQDAEVLGVAPDGARHVEGKPRAPRTQLCPKDVTWCVGKVRRGLALQLFRAKLAVSEAWVVGGLRDRASTRMASGRKRQLHVYRCDRGGCWIRNEGWSEQGVERAVAPGED